MRHIPATMATQHPDNASAPYWERDGDGFVSAQEEVNEAASAFADLHVDEYMWDWEGKYVDEAVIERLLSDYHTYFSKHHLGSEKFLTFRIPNIWQEKGYSLARAYMAMLTAADMARDLKMHDVPLFEVILPMTESAAQLIHVQETFAHLAKVKHRLFGNGNTDFKHIEVIPLVEGVENMVAIRRLLTQYAAQHQKKFRKKPAYLRVFIARSDPALISGIIAAVLGNKIALSEMTTWSERAGIPVYPIVGTGSLPFRGSCSPDAVGTFLDEYRGVRTVTIQSAFRYDYPLEQVKAAIETFQTELPKAQATVFSKRKRDVLLAIIRRSEKHYRQSVQSIAEDMYSIAEHIPKRRERRLHIGLLGYSRLIGKKEFPRAITFTAAMYSLGVPPELIGTGRTLRSLKGQERAIFHEAYRHVAEDMVRAGAFVNKENLAMLAAKSRAWKQIQQDIAFIESYVGEELGPKTTEAFLHRNRTSDIFFLRKAGEDFGEAILRAGRLRKSLG